MIYLYSTVRSTRTVRTVQVRTSAASAVTALHKKYSEVTALHKYVLRTCTELTVQVQVPASTYMYRTDCTSTGTFTTSLLATVAAPTSHKIATTLSSPLITAHVQYM
jgi:hypothetical protein